jgi:hypothetical protein
VHGEFRLIGKLHAIARFMELPVMRATEQHHSINIGSATVDPMIEVMDVAMYGFRPTTWRSTMSVASDNCSSLRRSRRSDFSAQIQHLRTRHENPLHHGIAGECCHRSCVEFGTTRSHRIAMTMQSVGEPGSFSR